MAKKASSDDDTITMVLDDGDGSDFDREAPGALHADGKGALQIITKRNHNGRPVILLKFMVDMPDGSQQPVRRVIRPAQLKGILEGIRAWIQEG